MNESANKFASKIADNFRRVRDRVNQAATDAGRNPDDIRIVGVTKYVDSDIATMLVQAGCHDIGESRPQVLEQKASEMADLNVEWHMIGHLQRNKVSKTLQNARWIHSVDSIRLAETIDRIAADQKRTVQILFEVNVSGDSAKHGFSSEEIAGLATKIQQLPHLSVCGLMCMAGLGSTEQETRTQFAELRKLRDSLQTQLSDGHRFHELSMGMSRDFEIAIAEGATMIRIGSILFEGIR